MNDSKIRVSKQIYSFLVKLYPKKYRREFGEEMKYVFSEQITDSYQEQGEYGIIQVWGRTMLDAGKSIVTQHLENQKGDTTMKNKKTDLIMNNKVFVWLAVATAAVLSIPLLMMQVSNDWNWGPMDFVIIGTLIFGTGSIFIFAARKAGNNRQRLIIGLVLLAAMLWLWAELAVGIFTNWGS